ncbi:hypothetical protein [Necropsobacter massiliensis]|uniref:hypothetical protein n=1 Tax=Necropsobacter massiliensis TaxID=1400001 RepID=UPI00117D6839|nr:hypothetical protein [Necropsobacter massiliensis]
MTGTMIDDFKAEYQALLQERFSNEFDMQTLMNKTLPALYDKRELILALWKISTKCHHLWFDIFLMIKQNFIKYAQAKTRRQHFEFQGEMLATLILASAKYRFEQNQDYHPQKIIKQLNEMMMLAFNE